MIKGMGWCVIRQTLIGTSLSLRSGWKKCHKISCEFVEDTGQLMMAPFRAALLAAALLFALPGSSSLPFCPESCSCQTASLLNCSLSGLTSVPQLIPGSFSEMDFSHNYLSSVKPRQPHQNLRKLWLGNNTVSHLSLCVERHVKSWHRFRNGGKRGCQGWAPTLQMLSVERNQLERLPEGLGGVPSLRILRLSFNKISVLKPGELSDLRQLEELHLHHNLITHLHPQIFQDLIQLRVLDLRFNLLTILHPLMYLNLRNIGAHVGLDGNRWKCDCNLRSLRRRMAYDDARGLEVWNVKCASPSKLLGTDLLQLKEEDLQCLSPENSPDLHQDVTVYSGSQILLSCSAEDSVWWTPDVPAPVKHSDGGLLITDISETNTGLYVCVSEEQQVVSVFNLQISQIESAAKTKSLTRTRREITPQSRALTARSNLVLAVCLSVIITFLVAFILGVVTRPYVELLWKRITTKKRSSPSNSVTSVEQRHYENAAFSNSDEAVPGGPYRERRVTFRNEDDIENINVQYYDTVANSDQNSVASDAVFASGEGPNTQESEYDQGMQQMNAAERQTGASAETVSTQIHQVEFEHIPDPDELEVKSLSSSSDSSLSENEEKITKRRNTAPKSPPLETETMHKRANSPAATDVQDPQVSIEIPGFLSEPFADWSPHSNRSNSKDELFDFSDSPRSTPARPNSGFSHTVDKQKSGDTSSSSSSNSGEESTQAVFHPKKGKQRTKIKSSAVKQSRHTSSSDESTDQETKLTKTHKLKKKWPSVALGLKAPSPAFSTSSSSDSEDETKDTETQKLGKLERPIIHQEFVTGTYSPDSGWPTIDVQSIPRIKRRLDFVKISSQKSSHDYWQIKHTKVKQGDITSNSDSSSCSEREEKLGKMSSSSSKHGVDKTTRSKKTDMPTFHKSTSPLVKAPSHSSSSSSSSESGDDVRVKIKPLEQNKVQTPTPQRIKDQTGSSSSSSSESEDDSHRMNQRQESWKAGQLQFQGPPSKDYDPHGRWPTVDLLHVPRINRRLDFKVPLSHSSSFSRENFDKTTSLKKVERPTFQTSTSPLVKASSQSSSSSSSSESEDGIEHRPGSVKIGQLQEPQPKNYDPHGRWPTVDLLRVPHISRRLDFKVKLSHSSSSSSDNIYRTTSLKKVQKTTFHTSTSPLVKASSQSSSSSSSSESDNDAKVQIKPLEQNMVQMSRPKIIKDQSESSSSSSSESEDIIEWRPGSWKTGQLQKPQPKDYVPDGRWPTIDLLHVPHINRRLDFKVPLSHSSSSSRDNIDRITSLKKVQRPTFHTSTSPPVKAPSQSSSSSSSSESDNETKVQIKPHEQNKVQASILQLVKDKSGTSSSSSSESEDGIERRPGSWKTGKLPVQEPKPKDFVPHGRWPTIDLLHVPHINRRLDFKVPLSHFSSSSRDNIDRTTGLNKVTKPTFQTSSSPLVKIPSQSSSSSSSSESDNDVNVQIKSLEQNKVQTLRPQLIKDLSESSSSSSSESEDNIKQRPGGWKTGQLQEPQPKNYDPHGKWPTVDVLHVPHIKRRLDFKIPLSRSASSSSNDKDIDRTTSLKKGQMSTLPLVKISSQSSSSSSSSESDNDVKVQIKPLEQKKVQTSRPQQIKDLSQSSSSSSSESEDNIKQRPGSWKTGQLQEPQPKNYDPHGKWPTVDLLHVPHIKRRIDFKIPLSRSASSSSNDKDIDRTTSLKKGQMSTLPLVKISSQSSSSSSSSESDNDVKVQIKPLEQKKVQTSRPQQIKDLSQSSSSSSSESEDNIKQRPGSWKTGQLQEPQPKNYDPHGRWPIVDLLHVPHIKRRLDFKVPLSRSASSSSNDKDIDRTTSLKKGQMSTLPLVKISSQSSSSSSSSESDNDVKVQIKPLEQNKVQTSRPQQIKDLSESSSSSSSESEDNIKQRPGSWKTGQLQEPQPKNYDPHGRWPIVDLLHVPHIKRRLDFKVPLSRSASSSSNDKDIDRTTSLKKVQKPTFQTSTSPLVKISSQSSSSSSSSESDDDVQVQIKPLEQNKVQTSTPQPIKDQSKSSSSSSSESEDGIEQRLGSWKTGQLQEPQPKNYDPHGRWPIVDLLHVPHIKRRLDFKLPLSRSLSSSNDKDIDRTTSLKKVQKPTFQTSTSPLVKIPSESSSSSSSSESDDDVQVQIKPLEQNKVQTLRPQPIKDQSESSSSSSSESEDGIERRPGSWKTGKLPIQDPQPKNYDPHGRWPIVDLLHVPHIKRRLDFKAPLSRSASSSSRDNNDRTTSLNKVQKPTFHTSTSPLVKAPSHSSSSSSGSESDNDVNVQIKPVEQNKVQTSRPQRIKDQSESSSSSSSESEDGTESHRVKQRQGSWKTGKLPILEPKTKDSVPHDRWPIVDLLHVPHINRRLDFKLPLPHSTSSSSNDKDIDRTTSLKKGQTSRSPLVKISSQSSSSSSSSESDNETKVQIKPLEQKKVQTSTPQRIKYRSENYSSSSSESEDDSQRIYQRPESWKAGQLSFQGPPSKDYVPHGRWPTVDFLHVPRINRRLDFKVPLSHSSSFSSENIDKTTSLEKVQKPTFQTSTSPLVKASSESSSSSSSSESENESYRVKQRPGSVKIGQLPFREPAFNTYDPHGRWPTVDLLRVPYINRRLDFKILLSRSSFSSSDDAIDRTTSLRKVETQTFHMSTSPYIKKASQSSSSSSSSESDNETKAQRKAHETIQGSLISKEEKKFTIKSSALNIHYPTKNTPNIVLQKYVTFEDAIENQPTKNTVYTSPESNLDLHRKWATMNLGTSRFRKHLEISSQTAPRPNLISPTPYSPGSESRSGIRARPMSQIGKQETTHTDSSTVLETDFDVGTREKDQGSSSSSGEETIKSRLPDLSLGVPRIKRRLDVKVLSPKMSRSSSSSSENESDSSSKQKNSNQAPDILSLAEDSVISYKRSIIKPFSLYNSSRSQAKDSMSTDMGTMDRGSAAPRSPPHLSFDDILMKQSEEFRLDTSVPLSPIRRTGVSLGVPSPFINKETKAKAFQVPPENPKSPQLESNIRSVAEILQDNRKPVTLGLEYSSSGSANVSSSFPVNSEEFSSFPDRTYEASKAVFEDRKEMRGFRALAAMSLARRKWDADSDRDESVSSDDHVLYGRNETDRALSEPPSHPAFASENDKRVLDLLYGVPSYRSHGTRSIKPPQEAPPPVPSTPSSDN